MMLRFFAFFVVLFLMLFDLKAVSAQGFNSDIFNFPSFNSFPFPSKSPKPTETPAPSATTSPSVTPTPAPSTILEIEDVEPSSANFMEEFTIYGSAFGSIPGAVNFRLSNQSFSSGGAPIVSWSDTEITAKVPAVRKGSYRIQVITSENKKSNEVRLTVKNGQPVINSTSLSNNNGEYELTFQGTEFGRRGSVGIYNGDSLVANGIIRSWSSSRIRFDIPNIPYHEYAFQITTADGRKSSLKYFSVGN